MLQLFLWQQTKRTNYLRIEAVQSVLVSDGLYKRSDGPDVRHKDAMLVFSHV